MTAVNQRAFRSTLRTREILSSWSAVIDYCHAVMAHETREQFRILFLDRKNGLIADEVQQIGTVNHTPVYPREVIGRALALSASALVLVHNHPSGDPKPSRADIEMTKTLVGVAEALGSRSTTTSSSAATGTTASAPSGCCSSRRQLR